MTQYKFRREDKAPYPVHHMNTRNKFIIFRKEKEEEAEYRVERGKEE